MWQDPGQTIDLYCPVNYCVHLFRHVLTILLSKTNYHRVPKQKKAHNSNKTPHITYSNTHCLRHINKDPRLQKFPICLYVKMYLFFIFHCRSVQYIRYFYVHAYFNSHCVVGYCMRYSSHLNVIRSAGTYNQRNGTK